MYSLRGRGTFCRKSPSLALPPGKNVGWGNAGGGGFSKRSSATSIGAACGRLFRLRKTAMLSRHWRLWLSFPSPGPLPKSGWGSSWFFLHTICPCEVGTDSCELVEVTAADRAAATVRGGGTPGEAASLREAPPPGPLPKSGWGSSWFFLHTICPCEVGADSCELVEVTAADRAAATVRGGGTPGEAASLREAPPPGPLPKSGWGSSWFFLHTICPCEVGADSCELVEVTAADRAAATVQGGGTPGEAASLREAPPPGPLPKSGWGSSWFFLHTICPCEVGADSCELVEVTAADRAAATVRGGGM